MMNPEASLRPSAADIVRHPMLFPLLRTETAACLRVSPPRHGSSVALGGDVSPADQSTMLKMHLRALDAETKVAKLQAMLQEAQAQAQTYKDCVEHALNAGQAMSNLSGITAASSSSSSVPAHMLPQTARVALAAGSFSDSKKKQGMHCGTDCSA
jgi:hypothetical protein